MNKRIEMFDSILAAILDAANAYANTMLRIRRTKKGEKYNWIPILEVPEELRDSNYSNLILSIINKIEKSAEEYSTFLLATMLYSERISWISLGDTRKRIKFEIQKKQKYDELINFIYELVDIELRAYAEKPTNTIIDKLIIDEIKKSNPEGELIYTKQNKTEIFTGDNDELVNIILNNPHHLEKIKFFAVSRNESKEEESLMESIKQYGISGRDVPKDLLDSLYKANEEADKNSSLYFVIYEDKFEQYDINDKSWWMKPYREEDMTIGKWIEIIPNNDIVDYFKIRLNKMVKYGEPKFIGVGFLRYDEKQQQQFIRVANAKFENCVIQCIHNYTKTLKKKVDVYKKFPELKPTQNQAPYITREQLDKLSKYYRLKINTYTELGSLYDMKWETFGYEKDTGLDIIISSEHAVFRSVSRIDEVIIDDNIDYDINRQVNVANINYKEGPDGLDIIDNYIEFKDGKNIMHKTYAKAGTDVDYAYIHSDNSYYAKLFRQKFGIGKVQDDCRQIVKSSENFISIRKFKNTNNILYESDANKCYCAYETNEYYCGFPIGKLTISQYNGNKFSFAVIKNVRNLPRAYTTLHNNSPTNVITYPTYQYLLRKGAEFEIDYVLKAEHKNISIIDYTNELQIDEDSKKQFRNQLIGRMIAGGLKEKSTRIFKTKNQAEHDQLLHECQKLGLDYIPACDGGLKIAHKTQSKGAFAFHSYILAYASIMMCEQFEYLESIGANIIGYIVDALMFTKPNELELPKSSDIVGEFKYQQTNEWFKKCLLKPLTDYNIKENNFGIVNLRDAPSQHTAYLGPPGIGKSYPLTNKPLYDQIFLTPSINLRESTKQRQIEAGIKPDTYCLAKYYQPSFTVGHWLALRKRGDVPRRRQHVVIDEVFSYSYETMCIILERAINIDNSIIEVTGDDQQICNAIDGTKITRQHLIDWGFVIKDIERQQGVPARNEYQYGRVLDSLRNKTPIEQSNIVLKNPIWQKIKSLNELDLDYTKDHVISGNHTRLNKINNVVKGTGNNILVRNIDGIKSIVNESDVNIWWDRINMREKFPSSEYKYEPYFGVTPDTYQGDTAENDQKIIIDINNLPRHGCIYAAITRTRIPNNIYILIE